MASANLSVATPQRDWIFANPWAWSTVGLLLCGWSCAWTRVFGSDASDLRVIPLALGLLAGGIALALRLTSSGPAYLERLAPARRRLALRLLALVFGLTALAITAVVVLAALETRWLPWRIGTAIVTWVIVGPVSAAAARRCLHHAKQQGSLSAGEESAALLLAAALTCFLGAFALYSGPEAVKEWDTLRLVLAVLAAVALVGAPLAAASPRARRLLISLLILLHFGGIMTASLAAPPAPWLVTQIWTRIYRPYLEFMYLNNAYHFYAPEPGPASYLWFRLLYEDTQDDGATVGVWYKVPRLDEKGRPMHSMALEYQRYLAMTENTGPATPAPPVVVLNKDGVPEQAEFYARRAACVPGTGVIIGRPRAPLEVPFDPAVPQLQQYIVPTHATKQFVQSLARHVCRRPHPDDGDHATNPRYRIKAVKIYRAVHTIPAAILFTDPEFNPRHPMLYRPFYLGQYSPEGELLDPFDPFLYWELPILLDVRPDPSNPQVLTRNLIRNYARLHAGDSDWVRENRKEALWPEP